jgi:hypothetical protein
MVFATFVPRVAPHAEAHQIVLFAITIIFFLMDSASIVEMGASNAPMELGVPPAEIYHWDAINTHQFSLPPIPLILVL